MSGLKRYSMEYDRVALWGVKAVECEHGKWCSYHEANRMIIFFVTAYQQAEVNRIKECAALRTCIEQGHDYGSRGRNKFCKRCRHRRKGKG